MTWARAALKRDSSVEMVVFRINPSSVTLTKTAQWTTHQNADGSSPTPQFVGANPRTLSTQVLLDTWDGTGDVAVDVERLLSWTCATRESYGQAVPQPPLVTLIWGEMRYFSAYLKSVTVVYTLFGDEGRPVRATVDLILEETPDDAARQNPTSGGIAGRSVTVVQAGDSLASIAYREYGKAGMWRPLARANGIDDPLRLAPGTTLVVPSAAEAAVLEVDGG